MVGLIFLCLLLSLFNHKISKLEKHYLLKYRNLYFTGIAFNKIKQVKLIDKIKVGWFIKVTVF